MECHRRLDRQQSAETDRQPDAQGVARIGRSKNTTSCNNWSTKAFSDFKDIVKSGRPEFRKNPEALDKLATGQVFTAKQALNDHLVDKLGYIEDAVQRAIDLNDLKADNVRVVKYEAPKSF